MLTLTRGLFGSAYLCLPSDLTRALGAVLSHALAEQGGSAVSSALGSSPITDVAELPAPRPPTWLERGGAAMVTAALLDEHGLDDVGVEVSVVSGADLASEARAVGDERAAVDTVVPMSVRVQGRPYNAHLLLPPTLIDAVLLGAGGMRPRTELLAERASWLSRARLSAPLECTGASISARELRSLEPGDIVAFAPFPATGRLRAFAGSFPVAINWRASTIRLTGGYHREELMSELLFDDAAVTVSCILGRISLSVREVLELQPGQVLAFGAPVGASVEIACGGQPVARGELVDIEGELGVRVLSVYEPQRPAVKVESG